MTDEHPIIEDAKKQAAQIIQAARTQAELEMKEALKATGTWIGRAHDTPSLPVRFVQERMCVEGRKGRKLLDFLLGDAVSCYCCSAIRGFSYGVVATALTVIILLLIIQ